MALLFCTTKVAGPLAKGNSKKASARGVGNTITTSAVCGGILEEDANYKNNRYHGECTMYDKKSGKLVQRGIYENGKMVKFLEGTPTRK